MTDHVVRNREHWDFEATSYVAGGERNWVTPEPRWGVWGIAEADVGLLPGDLDGRGSIELGCGTGYVSAWLARRGARPVGIDNSRAQLATARRLQREHWLSFPLLHGDAERLPFADDSFDVICRFRQAARRAAAKRHIHSKFARTGPVCTNLTWAWATIASWFGMHRFEWPDDDNSVEFHIPHGDWIRLLRANGFDVLDLVELQPPDGATTPFPYATLEWARRWPTEEVWKARKVR